jgi:hypothetical protein
MEDDVGTRRDFIKTVGLGVAAVPTIAPYFFVRAQTRGAEGAKGKHYPSQRQKHVDAMSGKTVWQLTDTVGGTSQTLYYTNRHATPDSRWLIYVSDRGMEPRKFNLYKMDLRSGESIQLTETGMVQANSPDISRDGKQVFYNDTNNVLWALDLETAKERKIYDLPDKTARTSHAVTVNSTDTSIIYATVGRTRATGYEFSEIAVRSALLVVDIKTGETRALIDGMSPMGHVAYSPKDPKLVLYSIHGPWDKVQRPRLINDDGTNQRIILRAANGEGIGHEWWGATGNSVFATVFGGREPQGIWGTNLDGTNERCVLAGPTISHGTGSSMEDRWVADENKNDTTSLWISRKGSPTPTLLCKMAQDWFAIDPKTKERNATPYHPHPRFLPNDTGVTFNSGHEMYLVEI